MEQALKKFAKVLENPYRRLSSWKIANRKQIIGCLPMYIPEEIIHAAGMLSVTLLGTTESITLSDRHLLTFTCNELRSCYDMLLKGEFEFLDGIVVPFICDQIRFTSDFWDMDHPIPFFHQMWLSFRADDVGKQFLISELNRLKSHLEEFSGKSISLEALEKSIHIYNEHRSLLRRIYELRRVNPVLISAGDMIKIVTSSMLMPKEEHSALLVEFLSQAEKFTATTNAGGKIGLILIGHPCSSPGKKLLDLIEELGAVILDDDLFTGHRYFYTDPKPNGDPIESLANHFVDNIPCPIKHYPDHFLNVNRTTPDYPDFVIDMFKRKRAKGVINLGVMYCDPYDFEYPNLKERLEKEKIPFLNIRTGLESVSIEAIRTRLAAFLEMLQS